MGRGVTGRVTVMVWPSGLAACDITGGHGLIMGVRGVAGVCGGTALVTQLETVTRPLDKSKKRVR